MFLHFPFNLIYYKNIFHSLSYVNFIILCNNYISTSSTSILNKFFFSSLHIQTVYNRLPFNSEPFSSVHCSLNVSAAVMQSGAGAGTINSNVYQQTICFRLIVVRLAEGMLCQMDCSMTITFSRCFQFPFHLFKRIACLLTL